MRPVASRSPNPTTARLQQVARSAPATKKPAFPGERQYQLFKVKVRASTPASYEWSHLRKVARAMFGEAAFGEKNVPGRNFKPLQLRPAQLAELAAHPKKIEQTIRGLLASGALEKVKGLNAEEMARVYARAARGAIEKPDGRATLTIATVNDDFTDRKTNLKRVDADVVMVQEAKNTDVRKVLSNRTHGVHQNTTRDDKAGSAVVWKKGEVEAKKSGYALGVRPNGAQMLTRWISWTDVKVDGVKVRMISVHRPPKRFSRLWDRFDANLAAFVKRSKIPVVVGLDANQQNPAELARKTGLKWHAPKGSIDGFLVSPGIKVSNIRRLPKGSSDHHPVVAKIEVSRK